MFDDQTQPDNSFAVLELTTEECWELLRSTRVGRLASCALGRPYVVPINFIVDEHTLVFRTAEGTKLAALRNASPVAFEIDDHDAQSRCATSVIVTGRATEVTEPADWDAVHVLPLFPWHVEPKAHFVRITPEVVTGRRFRAVYAN
jgi:nitroimidazol reductase NimA-like FMN-containing flavoprotein (pyridoxamine 5'-phosphate oxidase superfamily)